MIGMAGTPRILLIAGEGHLIQGTGEGHLTQGTGEGTGTGKGTKASTRTGTEETIIERKEGMSRKKTMTTRQKGKNRTSQ
jgi:hypothetical protein